MRQKRLAVVHEYIYEECLKLLTTNKRKLNHYEKQKNNHMA